MYTAASVGKMLRPECVKWIVNANKSQDGLLSKYGPGPYFGHHHFDNSAFKESAQWMSIWWTLSTRSAIPAGEKDCDTAKWMSEYLGKMLHSLQDFYAHSIWVELKGGNLDYNTQMWGGNAEEDGVPLAPIINETGLPFFIHEKKNKTSLPEGLVSGYVHNYPFPGLNGVMIELDGPGGHLTYNKDDPTTHASMATNMRGITNWQLARSAATRHSVKLFRDWIADMSPARRRAFFRCCLKWELLLKPL